jgi:hypothetical protein
MRQRYWINNVTQRRWVEAATVDDAERLVHDAATIGPGDTWQLFVRYGRTAPVLVGWGVGPKAQAA